MSHSKKLVRDTILTLIALGMFGSTNFVFNVVIGRFYGSEFLGEVSAALSTVLLFSYVVATSFPAATSKYISEFLGKKDEKGAGYVLKLSVIIPLIVVIIETILVIILSPYVASMVNVRIDLFLWAIPILPLYALYSVLRMVFYGYRNVKEYFKREIISDIVFFTFLTIIVIFRLKSLVYLPYMLLYIIFIMLTITFIRGRISKTHSHYKEICKKFIIFAGICFIGTFSSMGARNLLIMFSSYYLPSSEVGYISAALAISNVFFLVPNALQRVLLPEFSYLYGAKIKKKTITLLNKTTEYIAFFANIVIMLAIIFSQYIVTILYSSEFLPAYILLQILLTALWLRMVARPSVSLLTGTKYVHISNIAGLLGLIVSTILWPILIPTFGLIGGVIGYALGVVVNTTLNFSYAHKYFKLKYKIIIKNYLYIIIVTIIMVAIPINFWYKVIVSTGILGLYTALNRNILKRILKKML